MIVEFDQYYISQYKTLIEGRRAVYGVDGNEPETYYRKIIQNAAKACIILDLKKDDSALEIGSGIGDISKLISKTVKRLYCCDVNESLLSMAQVNCQDCTNVSFHCNLEHQEKPLYFLENNSIDKVLASGVFEHCDTDTILSYVKEVQRILKPSGLFYLRFNKLEKYVIKSRPIVDHAKILETIKELNFKIEEHNIFVAINIGPDRNKEIPIIILTLKKK